MKNSWQIKKLGEICDFHNGLWKGKKPPYIEVGVIRNTNFTKDGNLDDANIAYLNVEKKQFEKRKLSYGDIVLEKSGGGPKQPVGRVIIFNKKEDDFSFSNFTSVIRIKRKDQIDFKYLHKYLFFSYMTGVTESMQSHSTGIRNLNFKLYKEIEVPLPPFSEQRHIVIILDEVFEKIAKAKENAEKNLLNAHEVYESVLESLFKDSTNGYPMVCLDELIHTLTDYHANGSYQVLKQNVELKDIEDFAWMVRSTDFENKFQNEMRYITKSAYDFLAKSRIFGGEIIMSKIGNAGKVYLMPEIARPCSLAMNLFLIRLNEEKASNKYVYRYLKSKRGKAQIRVKLKGVATQTINKKSVRSLRIPLLPRDIQDRFVVKLENLEAEIKSLESIYQQKRSVLEELKKSILQKAFKGEL
jgi:type I restriction enzyme S subunit